MITEIINLPDNMVGFEATGDLSKEDFDAVLLPAVKSKTEKIGKLNYMVVLDTSLQNLTFDALMKDACLGIENFTKWKSGAI